MKTSVLKNLHKINLVCAKSYDNCFTIHTFIDIMSLSTRDSIQNMATSPS